MAAFVFISCTPTLNKKEFVTWMQNPENEIRVIREVNEVVFDVQFIPNDFAALQQKERGIGTQASRDSSSVKHFTLKIGLKDHSDILKYNIANQAEAQQNLYYYSYLFQDDIYLEVAGKKVPCALMHFEKSIDKQNSRTFHLMFDNSSTSEEFELVIESERLTSLPIRFKIKTDNIPQVSGL